MESEPAIAAMVRAISPIKPSLLKATPPKLPERSTTKATPILAPELIPNTEGPARGLRNTVCICKPLIDRPAPATKAVNACGKRDFQMIFCQVWGSSPVPVKMCHTALIGIRTEPNTMLRNKNTTILNMISRIKVVFRPVEAIVISRLTDDSIPVRNPVIIPGETL